MSSAESVSRHEPALGTARLWFGALGGHTAWTAQLLLSYFVVSLACRDPSASFRLAGVDGYQLLLVALTVLPAAGALAATVVAYRAWRAAGVSPRVEAAGTADWRGFLGLFGALLSGLFVATILVTGISLFYLRPCQ
jgi:hypothetical protein